MSVGPGVADGRVSVDEFAGTGEAGDFTLGPVADGPQIRSHRAMTVDRVQAACVGNGDRCGEFGIDVPALQFEVANVCVEFRIRALHEARNSVAEHGPIVSNTCSKYKLEKNK